MESCTLTSLARAAGLGVSTVSYALRDSPKIPPATRARVKKLAEKMGYRVNPAVAALMAHVKAGRQPKTPTKIAFVWIAENPTDLATPFNRQSIAGARERARERGYLLEEFRMFGDGMTSARLSQILRARGINGIVFSGCEQQTRFHLEMDWASHSTAIIGNARCTPELHRAGYYHFMGMRRIMAEVAARGYRRPVAVLESVMNERASRMLEAAFLAHHPDLARARKALIKLPAIDTARLGPWLRGHRPDVIIVTKPRFIAPIRRLLGPRYSSVGYAVISNEESPGAAAGVDPGHAMVAANAVDLVIGQLLRNETGIPAHPKEVLFAGHWIEGTSLRAREHVLAEFPD